MILVEYLAGFVELEVTSAPGVFGERVARIPSAIMTWIVGPRATLYRAPAIPDPNAHPRGDAGQRPEGHPAADLRHAGRLHLGRLPHRLAQRSPRHDRLHPLGRAYAVQGRRQARQGGHRQAHLAPRREDERLHGHGLHDVLRDDPRERDGHGPHDRIGEDANAAFDPKEVEAERTVVISEREGAENQPEFAVEEELWALAFQVHPYHWTPIGYKQDLAVLDREPLYRHYLRHYAPNNASLILVGGFDPAVAMQHVREAFSLLRPEAPPDPWRLAEPDQRRERRSDLVRPGPADLLSIGWHIPAAAHGDPPALILLSTVLGGWRGLLSFAAADSPPRAHPPRRPLAQSEPAAAPR